MIEVNYANWGMIISGVLFMEAILKRGVNPYGNNLGLSSNILNYLLSGAALPFWKKDDCLRPPSWVGCYLFEFVFVIGYFRGYTVVVLVWVVRHYNIKRVYLLGEIGSTIRVNYWVGY